MRSRGDKEYEYYEYIMNTNDTIDISNVDSIVRNILNKFVQRSVIGKQKYLTDLDRNDLEVRDWIRHAQEELMDGILYLEKLRQEIHK